jgi:hypothetical protein
MKLEHLKAPEQVKAWAKRLIDDLNRDRSGIGDLPTFADDAAAAAAGIPLKGGYVTPAGIVRRRVA